ncbi:Four and a half LIM domains protein 3 [Strongyloides ratti]|uniref:Four and a half LIM domains protein 3 n=1 Tax=Strongyloides ratti TaxID=34506 RepID=A0A090LAG3_STRRB|nr:Four and a half LIM domains protein 3 [Strongyloides ratti]CEF66756.1 Four and a half LIM domains protein 3 [Strongyloides ratti]
MPSKGFSKLFTSCYAGDEHSRGRKKNKREIPEFMDEVSLNLTTQTYELTDNTTGQHIYAIPFKNRESLSSDYDLDTLSRENLSYSSSVDTTRLSHYNDTFTIDIIPGSSDENSRRILQKIAESKQKTPTLKRRDIIDRNKLLINEADGYAKIIKTPQSKKKPILPQSPVLNFTKKPLLPKSGLSSSNSFIDKNNSNNLSKTNSKNSINILEDNYNEVEGICSSMINFCESPNNINNNKMSLSGYTLSDNKKLSNKEMVGSSSDLYPWRTAAFSGTNQRSLDALISPNLRPSIREIPKLVGGMECTKKDNKDKDQLSSSVLKNKDIPKHENEHQKSNLKSVKMINEKEILPKKISSHTSLNLSNERQLKFNISKSEESLSRPLKLKVSGKEKKCLSGKMTCCSPVTSKKYNNKNDNISQGSQSSEYHLKIINTNNIKEKKQPVSISKKTSSPSTTNHQIEKYCEEYSSSCCSSISSSSSSTSSLINKNNIILTSKENEEIKTKDGGFCDDVLKSSCNTTKEFNNLKVQKVKLRQKEDKKNIPINSQNLCKKDILERDMSMIATVYPFQRSSNNHDEVDERNDDEGTEKDHYDNQSHFKIEDVTDDPNYQIDDDKNEDDNYEGSLVEYCRLDSSDKNDKFNPRNSIFEAVTYRQSPPDKDINNMISSLKDSKISGKDRENNYRYSFIQPNYDSNGNIFEEVGKICPYSEEAMANILDIGVGEPCVNEKICKCHGFAPHKWRKVCVHCKCDRNDHEIGGNKYLTVYERLGITPTDVMRTVRNDAPGQVGHGYSWVPPGLSRVKVEEYMSQLPNHLVPRTNSAGEKHRERQLIMQLPRQDLSSAYCKHLKTPIERKVYEEFVNARNEVALDIGYVDAKLSKSSVCSKCNGIMEKGDLAVIAPKLGEQNTWHPACFTCKTCDQLLIDLTYCVRENSIYCERHYAELHKPRCSACDELIFSGEYTKAMNKDWHSDHFCCWQCDTPLTGLRYVLRDEHPFCIKCYEDVFANQCDECGKPIGIDSKDLSYKDTHWHPDCFKCKICKVSLVDKPFGSKNDSIFCSNCYDNAFATRCDGCNEIFRAGMKKMEYKGKKWHEKCFCCLECKVPIGTKSFIPKNDDVYCATCYEDKFATKCKSCKKVITTGGVTYKNEPYHRECFCCQNCRSSLAGQRFTSKDDQPYCANCYGELFAKRCVSCTKPITGIGGSKFISFEDRNYHNDCFICNQCSISLVGKGFITDGADILCPECAKARLMAQHS